jgi:hypothetical protein
MLLQEIFLKPIMMNGIQLNKGHGNLSPAHVKNITARTFFFPFDAHYLLHVAPLHHRSKPGFFKKGETTEALVCIQMMYEHCPCVEYANQNLSSADPGSNKSPGYLYHFPHPP